MGPPLPQMLLGLGEIAAHHVEQVGMQLRLQTLMLAGEVAGGVGGAWHGSNGTPAPVDPSPLSSILIVEIGGPQTATVRVTSILSRVAFE